MIPVTEKQFFTICDKFKVFKEELANHDRYQTGTGELIGYKKIMNGEYLLSRDFADSHNITYFCGKNLPLFEELEREIEVNNNVNYHLSTLPRAIQICIKTLCEIIDKRLEKR